MHRLVPVVVLLVGCAEVPASSRAQRVIDALADDNYVWAQRDPSLLALKLRKLQRGPYEWLRGTAALYWDDLGEPGGPRPATRFGSPAASRVLLVGDPHPENVGTFRAVDGTMIGDWNDFDGSGYGPFTGDLRRLGAALVIIALLGAPEDHAYARTLAEAAARGYADQIAELAAGERPELVILGTHPLIDKALAKAQARGDSRFAVEQLAPATNGVRALALGDLEEVALDGVVADRVEAVDAETAAWLERAIASWRVGKLDAAAARPKLLARRIGSGVASYAAYRFDAVLEGATDAIDDDRVIELKELREGLITHGTPQLQGAEWDTPGLRGVDTQRRLQSRRDADGFLGAAQVGGLSLKIRDREAYQRGLDQQDLSDLAGGSAAKRDELRALAELLGRMLARAHGDARTADGILGVQVIAPLLTRDPDGFVDELGELAVGDATQVIADHTLLKDLDLAALVIR